MKKFNQIISETPSNQSIEDHYNDQSDSTIFSEAARHIFIVIAVVFSVGLAIGFFVR